MNKTYWEKYRWEAHIQWVDVTWQARSNFSIYCNCYVAMNNIYVCADMSVDSSMPLRVLVSCLIRTNTSAKDTVVEK